MTEAGNRDVGDDRIRLERPSAGVCRLVLNAPDTLNSMDARSMNRLAELVEEAGRDEDLRVIVLTGSGRAFCSGADLDAAQGEVGATPDPSTIDAANRLVRALTGSDLPVVCALNGLAAGVGVSIVLACDVVVASETAYFLLAFTKVGLMPDGGATALVAASLGRSRALALALMAERLTASEAHAAGLVHSVSGAETFDGEVQRVVQKLAEGPTRAFSMTKRAINAATLVELPGALDRERSGQLDLLLGEDFAEALDAFGDKRAARFTGR